MVLPDVSEAMQRCKWNEVPSRFRIALTKYEVVRSKFWKDYWAELASSIALRSNSNIVRKRFRQYFTNTLSEQACFCKYSVFFVHTFKCRYNEYIADKNHVHMNGTCWTSLSGFVQTLASNGICEIEESERV